MRQPRLRFPSLRAWAAATASRPQASGNPSDTALRQLGARTTSPLPKQIARRIRAHALQPGESARSEGACAVQRDLQLNVSTACTGADEEIGMPRKAARCSTGWASGHPRPGRSSRACTQSAAAIRAASRIGRGGHNREDKKRAAIDRSRLERMPLGRPHCMSRTPRNIAPRHTPSAHGAWPWARIVRADPIPEPPTNSGRTGTERRSRPPRPARCPRCARRRAGLAQLVQGVRARGGSSPQGGA